MHLSLSDLVRNRKRRKTRNELLKELGWTKKEAQELLEGAWNLNTSLALVLAYSAKKMRKYGVSYPPDLTPREWDGILRKIETGAELYLKEDEWIDLWDSDRKAYDKNAQQVEEALELTKKYFWTLWD